MFHLKKKRIKAERIEDCMTYVHEKQHAVFDFDDG